MSAELGPVSRVTLTESVEAAVRDAIVTGEMHPGRRLRIPELARRFGVSATPVREALQRLSEQGFVQLDPQLGAQVSPVSTDDVLDAYAARLIIEPVALFRSVKVGGDNWRESLEECWLALTEHATPHDEHLDLGSWAEHHRAFHWTLLAACDSPWLLRILRLLLDHSGRYALLARDPSTLRRNWVDEHRWIYESAVSGDAQGASQYLAAHLRRSVEALVGPDVRRLDDLTGLSLPQDG
jgi:DNA-binding GntR family transcriptional regulator